eukprot:15436218-Alexandrium_andersonii.AAC.1
MGEAVAPSRLAGRSSNVPRSESTGVGDPFSCSSERPGRRAKRGTPGAQRRNLGVADFHRFR